jgi:hypothetical protein
MLYGLYVARAKNPVFTGTAGECQAQVHLLTDEQKRSGWTIGPIPQEPAPLPVDFGLEKRIFVAACVVVGIALILLGVLYARGYFS